MLRTSLAAVSGARARGTGRQSISGATGWCSTPMPRRCRPRWSLDPYDDAAQSRLLSALVARRTNRGRPRASRAGACPPPRRCGRARQCGRAGATRRPHHRRRAVLARGGVDCAVGRHTCTCISPSCWTRTTAPATPCRTTALTSSWSCEQRQAARPDPRVVIPMHPEIRRHPGTDRRDRIGSDAVRAGRAHGSNKPALPEFAAAARQRLGDGR